MEFDELLITTGVDALVRLVKDKQRIELAAASKSLNIPESTVEEWVRVLEEEKILRMEYKLTKIYIVWVPPTSEEVREEQASFYQTQKELGTEISKHREALAPAVNELTQMQRALAGTYEKLAPRLEALESVAGMGTPAAPPSLEAVRVRTEALRDELTRLREEWKALNDSVASSALPGLAKPPSVDALVRELDGLEKKAETLKKGLPKELPVAREIEKKAAELKIEFRRLQSNSARIREDLRAAGETQDIVQEMKGQLERYSSSISGMRNELAQLGAQFQALQQQSEGFFKRIREEREAIERFSDSLDVANDILAKYPSMPRAMGELEAIAKTEAEIKEKLDAVEALMGQLGSPKQVVDEFLSLQKKIRESRDALEKGSENYAEAMEEQKSLFGTFEKIRDRTAKSIREYTTELAGLQKQLAQFEKESASAAETWEANVRAWQKKLKTKEFQELAQSLEGVRAKTALLGELRRTVDQTLNQAENLNRRLTLLAQQAKLLEIRAGEGIPSTPEQKAQEESLRQQLTLTQKEEEDFQRKREELRRIIKKLWEQS